MKITNEELKNIYFGAYRFEENEGYLEGYHFTEEQIDYLSSLTEFWAERSRVTNAKTLEFTTAATEFSFDYKVLPTPAMDTVELMIDGVLVKICEGYDNIKVVDGLKLVPHLNEYFLDGLHPNALGSEVYGRNLVEEIRKLDF